MDFSPLKIGLTFTTVTGLVLLKRRLNGRVCSLVKDLSNKTVIITGASSGIGKETAKSLAKMNARVIFACRNQTKATTVIKTLQEENPNIKVEYMNLDLASLQSIRNFAKQFQYKHKKLDILINNAGVINLRTKLETQDGFEGQFGVNYLGHFYLTNLLLNTLVNTPSSRVINVTCNAFSRGKMNWDDLMSERKYSPQGAYSQSKLALALFTRYLNKKVEKSNVKVVAVHPGVARTDLLRDLPKVWYLNILQTIQTPFWYYFTKSPWYGAQTVLHCSLEELDKLEGGGYYVNNSNQEMAGNVKSDEDAEKLWNKSKGLLLEKKFII